MERFADQVDQDEKDKKIAQEMINEQLHQMKMKDKSIIERESERLVREENDSLALELDTDGQPSLDII